MADYASQQQAWWQAILQQQARYQDQMRQALDLATFHQALTMPRQYGYGAMANPLLARASNTGTALFQPTNPQAGSPVQQYLQQAGQAGDTGISSNPELMQALLGRGGA